MRFVCSGSTLRHAALVMSFPVQIAHNSNALLSFKETFSKTLDVEKVATALRNVAVICITKYFLSTDHLENNTIKICQINIRLQMRQYRWAIMWQSLLFISPAGWQGQMPAFYIHPPSLWLSIHFEQTWLQKTIVFHKHLTRVAHLTLIHGGGLLVISWPVEKGVKLLWC